MQDLLLNYIMIVLAILVTLWIGAEVFDHYFPKKVTPRLRGATRNNTQLNNGETL